jgi:polyhydroxyalkanoate synthesis regulator phasin
MDDLVKQLKDKAGLTDEQAQKSMQVLVEYVQSKLPPFMHGMIDNFISSNTGYDDLVDKAEGMADKAKDKMSDWANKAEDAAKDAINKFKKKDEKE